MDVYSNPVNHGSVRALSDWPYNSALITGKAEGSARANKAGQLNGAAKQAVISWFRELNSVGGQHRGLIHQVSHLE